jgi:hypothetical protein
MLLLLNDAIVDGFWKRPDFWIELGIAIIGAIIGLFAYFEAHKSFVEARKAKDAAIKAGKNVKKQSIMLSVSETIRLCQQIRSDINYEGSNSKLMDICGKVRNIIGLYRDDLGQTHQGLFQQIEASSTEVLTQFNIIDPDSESKAIYKILRPIINTLTGHLYELQGILENELISNN